LEGGFELVRKVLIICPHFPPSSLAAVHRTRLFAKHLPSFDWEPVVLVVHEKFYEEEHDWNIVKLLPPALRIEKVNALPVTKPRLIGDIGLRAFVQLTRKAIQLIKQENISFLYIPIPSFYIALIGRIVHARTGIKYGIDYIDPWVHTFAGSDKMFSRHWWSTKLSSLLEPIAVKKASLVTGVSEGYYKGVIERNPRLKEQAVFAAMPYGGEKEDHDKVKELKLSPYLFQRKENVIQLVYAGAMLPKAYKPLERIFEVISDNQDAFNNAEFHFIGTGKSPNDLKGYNIKALAEKYGLWEKIVFEYPKRIPYLDALIHLEAADGVFILGSTEPHYTPSKVYQGVLSKKPVLAVLHKASTACSVIRKAGAGIVLNFDGVEGLETISEDFLTRFHQFVNYLQSFDFSKVDQREFEKYSAKHVTGVLADALDKIIPKTTT
jgi:hypothetical protein